MAYQDNFFINEIRDYYLSMGKHISENIINILKKSLSELSEDEKLTYFVSKPVSIG